MLSVHRDFTRNAPIGLLAQMCAFGAHHMPCRLLFHLEPHISESSHRGVRYFVEPQSLFYFPTGIASFAHIGSWHPCAVKV